MVSLHISVSPNMVLRPAAKNRLGVLGKDAHGPTESASLWMGLVNLYFYQMPQVILRHEFVQVQLLEIMHRDPL